MDTGVILNPDLILFNFVVANFAFCAFKTPDMIGTISSDSVLTGRAAFCHSLP